MNQTPARIIRPSPPWRHLSISLLMRHKPSRPCRCCPAHSVAILSWTEAGAKIWGTIHLGDPQGASPSTAMQKLLQAPFSNARGIRNPDIELVTKTIHRANPAHQQPGAPPTKIPQDKTAPRNAINGHSSGFPGEVTNIIEAEPSITTTPGREVRRSFDDGELCWTNIVLATQPLRRGSASKVAETAADLGGLRGAHPA